MTADTLPSFYVWVRVGEGGRVKKGMYRTAHPLSLSYDRISGKFPEVSRKHPRVSRKFPRVFRKHPEVSRKFPEVSGIFPDITYRLLHSSHGL
jgi:hypothetical protein